MNGNKIVPAILTRIMLVKLTVHADDPEEAIQSILDIKLNSMKLSFS
jgi:hypothetical protein